MLQFGKSITTPGDPLQALPVERLYHGIRRPKQEFRDRVQQLRMVKSLDEKKYRDLKKQLPYFVCGRFHPAVRRKENFASIEYFMLDLDHLEAARLDRPALLNRLREEAEEVVMGFSSPGADGLKLMFRLSEPCRDAALFSAFYKVFARRFAEQRGLMEAMDFQTSDVTRACFISVDDDAFFNPLARPVVMEHFIRDLDYGKAAGDIREAERIIREQKKSDAPSAGPDADVLLRIKQKLNPGYRAPRQKEYYVPPEVDGVLAELNEKLAAFEMQITETGPISYGRKLKIQAEQYWAEINIFYGKQGFRVVQTTRSGSNASLAELAARVISEILAAAGK